MAFKKGSGRQTRLVARAVITYDELTSGTALEVFDMPAGAIYMGGHVHVKTAWDSGTSDVLDVGDGDNDDRYTSSQIDITSTGVTALDAVTAAAVDANQYTEKDTIDAIWTGTGTAPTQGELEIVVEYIRTDRAVETQT